MTMDGYSIKYLCLLFIIGVLLSVGCASPSVSVFPPGGSIIMDGYCIVNENQTPVILIDNPLSVNPTYSKLKDFILRDKTDSHSYIHPSYTCGDFAETLHNNAEKDGIRSGVVIFPDINHLANAFETVDKGLIFIDNAKSGNWPTLAIGVGITKDTIVYFEEGKPLGHIEINVAEKYGFKYTSYKLWKQRKFNFINILGSRYSQHQLTFKERAELRELGGFFEEKGIVYRYIIFWEGKR